MPKIIDHAQRRHDIAVAACRAINRHGLDAVTLAQIAREAGSTTGMLAHYFDTKWDVILAALRLMHDRLEKRLSWRLESQTADLVELLSDALPIGDEQRAEAAAWLTFWGAALKHPEILEMTEQTHADWRSIIRRCLKIGCPAVQHWPRKLVDEIVSSIVVFMDGLSVKALTRPSMYTPKLQTDLLGNHISALLMWAEAQGSALPRQRREHLAGGKRMPRGGT